MDTSYLQDLTTRAIPIPTPVIILNVPFFFSEMGTERVGPLGDPSLACYQAKNASATASRPSSSKKASRTLSV